MNADVLFLRVLLIFPTVVAIILALINIRNANKDLKLGKVSEARFQTVLACILVVGALAMAIILNVFKI